MVILSTVPIVLSLLVLGAHFLRFGQMPAVFGTLVLIGLLFVRRPWAARIVQVALVFATVEWLRTLMQLTLERMHAGQPYMRMAAIIGIVAAVTLLSALLFQTRRLGSTYGLRPKGQPTR
jgi:hypothetical protein